MTETLCLAPTSKFREANDNWINLACGYPEAATEARLLMPGSGEISLNAEQQAVLQRIGADFLALVDLRYGCGPPQYEFSHADDANRQSLWHNNGRHARAVGRDAIRLAEHRQLGPLARYSLPPAAFSHDVDQTNVTTNPAHRDGSDELRSAQELVHTIREEKDLPAEVALWQAYFIMGTRVITEGSKVVGQWGGLMQPHDMPSKEAWLSARIGACADMGRLFDDYYLSYGLFAQRRGYEFPDGPDLSDPTVQEELCGFIEGQQLELLSGYQYPLPEGEALFGKNRAAVISHTKQLAARARAGGLPTTWLGFMSEQADTAKNVLS